MRSGPGGIEPPSRAAPRPGPAAPSDDQLARIILVGLVGAAITAVRAAVMAHLWQWFGADPFGLPRVGVWPTAGLLLLLGFVGPYLAGPGSEKHLAPELDEISSRMVAAMAVAGVAMLIGLVFVQFR